MQISKKALKALIKEAIKSARILSERPWSVEYTFSMKGGPNSAEDSEGSSADGFVIKMSTKSGTIASVIVDSYWNPQSGDQSGNSIKFQVDGEEVEHGNAYIPYKFDNGKRQRLLISNTPVSGLLTISHAVDEDSLPIVYLALSNPFEVNEDIEFDVENLGSGEVDVELTDHINV